MEHKFNPELKNFLPTAHSDIDITNKDALEHTSKDEIPLPKRNYNILSTR